MSRKTILGIAAAGGAATVLWLLLWSLEPAAGSRVNGSQPAPDTSAGTRLASTEILRWKERIHGAAQTADFEALLWSLLQLPTDDPARAELLAALLTQWLDRDMTGLIAFLDREEVEKGSEIWRLLSPTLARALLGVSDETSLDARLSEVIRRWVEFNAEESPDVALDFARRWLEGDSREASLATIAATVAASDPDRALTIFDEIRSPVRRIDAMNGIGPALVARDPQRALRWASSLPQEAEQTYAMAGVISALAEVQPDLAVREAVGFRTGMQERYRQAVLAETGKTPEQFAAQDPGDRESAPSPENPQMHLLREPLMDAAQAWAERDPYATLRWLDGVQEDALRAELERSAFTGWAATDSQAALDYLQVSRREVRDGVSSIFSKWSESDPAAAAAAVSTLEQETDRVAAARGLAESWSNADAATAAAWARSLPAGEVRDAAGAAVASALIADDPQGAWELALSIQHSKQRAETLDETFSTMVSVDPDTARDELRLAQLSPEESRRLGRLLRTATGDAQ